MLSEDAHHGLDGIWGSVREERHQERHIVDLDEVFLDGLYSMREPRHHVPVGVAADIPDLPTESQSRPLSVEKGGCTCAGHVRRVNPAGAGKWRNSSPFEVLHIFIYIRLDRLRKAKLKRLVVLTHFLGHLLGPPHVPGAEVHKSNSCLSQVLHQLRHLHTRITQIVISIIISLCRLVMYYVCSILPRVVQGLKMQSFPKTPAHGNIQKSIISSRYSQNTPVV
jgi:hypothetical protein